MIDDLDYERSGQARMKQPVRLHSHVAPPTQLLSTRKAATLLGTSERTIRRAIVSGERAAAKVGSAYRLNRASLEAFAAQTGRSIALTLPHLVPMVQGAGVER